MYGSGIPITAGTGLILGDSIAHCLFQAPDLCGPKRVGAYIQSAVNPELVIESFAAPGAVMADLPAQAAQVDGGPGHVAVWFHILGNDFILRNVDVPAWDAAWEQVFAYFTDAARFPDGATFMLNTQYGLSDQCHDVPGGYAGISKAAEDLLQELNRSVFLDRAEARDDTVAVDQYPDWLGHGNNADVQGCPQCGADNTPWLSDGTHPNAVGYAHMADKWKPAVDRMWSAECAE